MIMSVSSVVGRMIGLFCKRALQKRLYSAKETYHFKKPANRSHTIVVIMSVSSAVSSENNITGNAARPSMREKEKNKGKKKDV